MERFHCGNQIMADHGRSTGFEFKTKEFTYNEKIKTILLKRRFFMKFILTVLFLLSSFSVFASSYRICDQVYNTKVCSDVTEYRDGSIEFSNFEPAVQSVRSFAKTACKAANIGKKYKVRVLDRKSCAYLAMKGDREGKLVNDCNESGRNINKKVIARFLCDVNEMQPVWQFI